MNSQLDAYLNQVNTKEDWDEVWAMTKAGYGMWEAQQGRRFKIGDSVTFDIDTGRHRGHYTGTITKMTPRTATISVKGSYYPEWRIGYAFLKLTTNQVL